MTCHAVLDYNSLAVLDLNVQVLKLTGIRMQQLVGQCSKILCNGLGCVPAGRCCMSRLRLPLCTTGNINARRLLH